jgi:sugar transferase (PEP-CTERM/EpsH1 system associated)
MSGGEILFICHRIPFPPDRGDKIRSHNILQKLTRLAPVHVACFADDELDLAEEVELAAIARSYKLVRRELPLSVAGLQALVQGKPVSLTAFYHRALADYIRNVLATGRIGCIYVFSGQMGQYVPADFAGRVIMDFVDVDSAKFEAYAKRGKKALRRMIDTREARLLRAEEARLAARADVSLLISHREAELFNQRLGREARAAARVQVLGNGIDCEYFDPALMPAEPKLLRLAGPRLIFTGQMDYQPNIDAVERVARSILPLVHQTLPQASFHIVGRNPTPEVSALAHLPGVYVWGRVPDIRGWMKGATMALVPLDIARGVQNKVLEAMAMELPVVLSPEASNGIAALSGLHFSVAESDEAFAKAVIALAQDPDRASTMGTDARRLVEDKQSWHSALSGLVDLVAASAAGPAHAR